MSQSSTGAAGGGTVNAAVVGRFVGVGIGSYTLGTLKTLPRAAVDVAAVGRLVGPILDARALIDPDKTALDTIWQGCRTPWQAGVPWWACGVGTGWHPRWACCNCRHRMRRGWSSAMSRPRSSSRRVSHRARTKFSSFWTPATRVKQRWTLLWWPPSCLRPGH